jgi:hypothetical protein
MATAVISVASSANSSITTVWPSIGTPSGLQVPLQPPPSSSILPKILLPQTLGYGWSLTQPLQLILERDDDGSYILSDGVFAVYGSGDTEEEAYADYIISLIDYYELLASRVTNNDPNNSSPFSRLQQYLSQTQE